MFLIRRRRWLHSWCFAVALMIGVALPLSAHTFTTLTADLLNDGDDLSLTLGLQVLDAIAIIDGKPTSAGSTLTATQLRAGSGRIRAYLTEHLHLKVNGKLIPGACPGYVPDLINPPKPGDPPAELLPDRIPFLIVWTLPKGTSAVEIEFDLLVDLVGNGVVHCNLYQGDRTQSHFTNLGGSVIVTLGSAAPAPVKKMTQPATDSIPAVPSTAASTTVEQTAIAAEPEAQITSTSLSAWHLLTMGYQHIIPAGFDHILFVICLFLLSPKMKPLLIQVTAFTLAHSVTLGLAMAGLVLLPSRVVETLIALSIVVMAVENLFLRDIKPWRWMLVFLFGLVHGLGFAGSFASLHMQSGDFIRPLLLLNIGIELAQLSVVAACIALTGWMWQKPWYRRAVVQPVSVLIALVATWWTIQRAFGLS